MWMCSPKRSNLKSNLIAPRGISRCTRRTLTMKTLKSTRAVTYRRYGIPSLILEGKWLTEKYQLRIGDVVDIDYQLKEIRLKKNVPLSREKQKKLAEIEELRQMQINFIKNGNTSPKNSASEGSDEISEG